MIARATAPAILVLAGLALGPLGAAAQEAVPPLAGADTSETSTKAKGLPWIAHSSAEAFYLQSPSPEGGGSQPYQVSTYQGVTIQSLSFASFHAGWRYRETLAEGLDKPFRELFALKLMGTAEILRDFVFVTLGGSIPLFDNKVAEADTLDLYRALNEYNPLPAPNFVSPQGVQVGMVGRYRAAAWDLMTSVYYVQPTRFEPVAGHAFSPASLLGMSVRGTLETRVARHRLDLRTSRFGVEQTAGESQAHKEGPMLQMRYEWLRARGRTAWQLGGGFSVKAFDMNRPLRLRTELERSDGNDNVQRAFAELGWTWTPSDSHLWRAWLLPKALLEGRSRESGHETELGLALGMRLWEVHRLRVAGTVLGGSFKGRDYLGVGTRAEFAFRHLGFQDMEPRGEGGGGG